MKGSPCRGTFLYGCHPKSLPCKGRCRRRRRRGAAPDPANTLPGRRAHPAAAHPAKHEARRCRALRGISATKRQYTPQSAVADSSPCRGAFPNGSHPQSRQNKYSPEHGGSGLYCFVPRPRSGGPYSEITEANGRRDKPAHGGKPGAEAPHAASPNCAGGPLR